MAIMQNDSHGFQARQPGHKYNHADDSTDLKSKAMAVQDIVQEHE